MKIGDTLIVVRVLRGQKPPRGFTHRHDAPTCHHHKYSTHAVRLVKAKKCAKRSKKKSKTRSS